MLRKHLAMSNRVMITDPKVIAARCEDWQRARKARYAHKEQLRKAQEAVQMVVPLQPREGQTSNMFRIEKLLIRDGHVCWLCGGSMDMNDTGEYAPTADHVIPKRDGGRGTLYNLRAAHFACNNRRAALTPYEAWLVLEEFARIRDPDLILYREAPAKYIDPDIFL